MHDGKTRAVIEAVTTSARWPRGAIAMAIGAPPTSIERQRTRVRRECAVIVVLSESVVHTVRPSGVTAIAAVRNPGGVGAQGFA